MDSDCFRVGLVDPHIADHNGQFICLDMPNGKIVKNNIVKKRNISNRRIRDFKNNLSNISWENLDVDLIDAIELETLIMNTMQSNVDMFSNKTNKNKKQYKMVYK